MRKRIIYSSIFTISILLCSYGVSSVQMQAVQASVEKTVETTIAENKAMISSLSIFHTGLQNGLLFMLTQAAKLYHSVSLFSSSMIYPFFEWMTLFLFSVYTASSLLPVSFLQTQMDVVSMLSSGLPTWITVLFSFFGMSAILLETVLFLKYVSVLVFLFLLGYTYILPYWCEICYYTPL